MDNNNLPDPSSQKWGWQAAKIDGIWCVGTTGNLHTLHDATVEIHAGFLSDDEARQTAEWIAAQYNAKAKLARLADLATAGLVSATGNQVTIDFDNREDAVQFVDALSDGAPAQAREDVLIGEFIARYDDGAQGVIMDVDTAQALALAFKNLQQKAQGTSK